MSHLGTYSHLQFILIYFLAVKIYGNLGEHEPSIVFKGYLTSYHTLGCLLEGNAFNPNFGGT